MFISFPTNIVCIIEFIKPTIFWKIFCYLSNKNIWYLVALDILKHIYFKICRKLKT